MSVNLVKAPLRISLGGGGTDLPSFYRHGGGFVVSGTLDKYVYMMSHPSFTGTWQLKYSSYEEVDDPGKVKHPLFREALLGYYGPPLEISVAADVPAGTGLGSSGAFTVCLLKTLALAEERGGVTAQHLAEQACDIEIERLGYPVGKQDQYAAAYGGICAYAFEADDELNQPGEITVRALDLSPNTREKLRNNLLAFYTGRTRRASEVLSDQQRRTELGEEQMIDNLFETKKIGFASARALEEGNLQRYAQLLHSHWENKRERSPGITTEEVDRLYTLARRSGALGGKLVGAGGGGYLLVYTERPDDTREAMRNAGISELRFDFQPQGCHSVT